MLYYFTLAEFLVADLLKLFHNKTYCICLFLDLRKAFDTANVGIFVEKLKMCGIRGTASLLINSYLFNTDQYVVCDDYKSDVLPLNVGVPQRYVLGPLLFNIFINNISQLGMKNVIFADDVIYTESVSKIN